MTTSDQIGSSHVEVMNRIVEFVTSFDVDKLLYAISTKRIDEETVRSITLDIRGQDLMLERQKEFLFSFGRTFNKKFTTDDNKCFDTSARLTFKMRSGIKGIKTTVRRFCMRSRRRLPEGQTTVQAIDRSLIATETYMRDLFGLESFPPCVKELFEAMVHFYNNMYECLDESLRVLAEEKDTRQNKRKCLELLEEACDKCKKNQSIFVEALEKNPTLKEVLLDTESLMPNESNPVLKEYRDSKDNEGVFASIYFHNCTLTDVDKITFYKIIREAEGDADLIACMTVFNCDREKALSINYAIKNFDSLLPEKCRRNKIPALLLFVFMRWCSNVVGYATFLNYFNKRYKDAGGLHDTIGKTSLSGPSRLCAKNSKKYVDADKQMNYQLEKLLSQMPIL